MCVDSDCILFGIMIHHFYEILACHETITSFQLVKTAKYRDPIDAKCTDPLLIETVKFVYIYIEKYTMPTTFL